MYQIDASTKISALIQANPQVVDVIAGINSHFKKLHNPILRKVLASRVTIAEAAKIGKVDISVFFERLKPLGFVVLDTEPAPTESRSSPTHMAHHHMLDVRATIGEGKDPFRDIMKAVEGLHEDETLLLINSFEPIPLIRILTDRGYELSVSTIAEDIVHTFITKRQASKLEEEVTPNTDFDFALQRFEGKMQTIDVRTLPMPQPMMTILQALESLPADYALFVFHKKVPLFLLPELKERHFSFAYKQAAEGVHVLIYREEATAP